MASNLFRGLGMVKLVKAGIALLGAVGAVGAGRVANAQETSCAAIAAYEGGRSVAQVCADKLPPGLEVLDLGDRWAPRIFSETPDHPQTYRDIFVGLANGEVGEGREAVTARRDRYFELFGISPSLSVIEARLLDEPRHACHAAIDDGPLRALTRTVTPGSMATSGPGPTSRAVTAALAAVQSHLRCEGLLAARTASGRFDGATQEALRAYQRRHMVPSAGVVDEETRATFLTESRELDFRTLLRALRERVVEATGLIEDGSASHDWRPILGRFVDSLEYRRPMRPDALDAPAHAATDTS